MRQRLLMLVPESPLPPRCGNAWRDAQQITLLRRLGFEVYLAILQRRIDLGPTEEDAALAAIPHRYATCGKRDRESLAQLLWRKAGYLAGSRKNAYAWWTESFRPDRFATEVIVETRPAVLLMRSLFLHFLPEIRRVFSGPVVVDCHDADVHLASETVKCVAGLRKLGPWLNLQAVRRSCRSYLPLADEVWAVSFEDAERILEAAPSVRVVVVPSGMEPGKPVASPGLDAVALMVANYGYKPNENGAMWLLGRVWPLVLHSLPKARLDLVGGRMPPALQSLAAKSRGVRAYGAVPHVEPFYEEAGVIVAPILEGGGTRLKIVEAWSRGKAVLTTAKGIEGLPDPAEAAVIRDDPGSFADALCWLLLEAQARSRLGHAGLKNVTEHLSYAAITRRVVRESLLSQTNLLPPSKAALLA